MDQPGQRVRTTEDWHNLLVGIRSGEKIDLKALRQDCWRRIEELRKRPLLVYAVQYPSNAHDGAPIHINLSDIDGFIDLTECTDSADEEVDVLIHSPGGDPTATERIVEVLRERFKKVCFLVPHSAYSAATLLALSGDEIVLHPAASLGPIDPQINGIPARSILRGFDRAKETLKSEGPEAIPAYAPLIEKHSLETLELCEDAEALSRELASNWLNEFMFSDERGKNGEHEENGESEENSTKEDCIVTIVDFFAKYDEHKTHARPLTYRKLQGLGLKIKLADDDLKGLLREGHILLQGFFSVTGFVKIFENSSNLSWGTIFQGEPNPESPPAD